MKKVCATTLVAEDPDGSRLSSCSRCKLTNYKDATAQKSAWKIHKMYCREMTPSDKSFIDDLSLSETSNELKKILSFSSATSKSQVSHCAVYLLLHIRKLLDANADDPGSVELALHAMCRSLIFCDSRTVQVVWNMPGMANYLMNSDQEDLLNEEGRFTKEHLDGISKEPGVPSEEWIDSVYAHDEEKCKRLKDLDLQLYHIGQKTCFRAPSSMKICYAYYNLIVAAAVQCRPSMSSVHDGVGKLRLDDGSDNVLLTIAALRRAMQLWADNFVRGGCGDAMAPAASLAFTAIQEFAKYASSNHHPKHYFVSQLLESELIPGLDIAELVSTTLSEYDEGGASVKYSGDCLEYLAKHSKDLYIENKFDALTNEKRAEVILAIINHALDGGSAFSNKNSSMYSPSVPVPKALERILDCVIGQDLTVLKIAADNELLGPKNPGRNISSRGVVHYCIRNFEKVKGSQVLAAIKIWESVPYTIEKVNGATEVVNYNEKEGCRTLALGAMKDREAEFKARLLSKK